MDLYSDTPDGTPVLANGYRRILSTKTLTLMDSKETTPMIMKLERTGDAFPLEPTQWWDKDGDGYGDSSLPGAFEPDSCVNETGNSALKILFNGEESPYYGCLDGMEMAPTSLMNSKQIQLNG